MSKTKLQFAALFLISTALIAYELNVMRVFAVGSWDNFGSMVISIALLGYGLAGTLLTFLQKRVKANPEKWLTYSALAITPAMAIFYAIAQHIPFNPIFLVSDPSQIFWLASYYAIYVFPFFTGAVYIGVVFIVISEKIHKLYFWNMTGSGIGGLLLLFMMYLMPVRYLIYVILAFSTIGGLLIAIKIDENGKLVFPRINKILAAAAFVIAFSAIIFWGDIQINEYKALELAKVTFNDLEEVHSSFSPLGEKVVNRSAQYHFAPGLSDNAVFYIDQMPKEAFWALYVDGSGPINIMRQLEDHERRYIDFLPMSSVYRVLDNPNVLLMHLGGGFSAHTALHNNAKKVTIVEPNPDTIKLIRDVPEIREHTGDLLHREDVRIVNDEPRAFAARTDEKFDLVEISLIDSVGMSQSTGNSIYENYVYTVEAMQDYLKSLDTNGFLSITTWDHLAPPRNVPRLLTTVTQALLDSGVENPENRIFGFNLIYSTATVLVKNSDFTQSEIDALKRFCYINSFEAFYYPGKDDPGTDFERFLLGYWQNYGKEVGEPGLAAEMRRPAELYYNTVRWMLEGRSQDLYDQYIFDVRPTRDDRPFYTVYMKPAGLMLFLDKMEFVSEEWSYLLIMATLIQSLFFGLLIILIPLFGARKSIAQKRRGKLRVILYYSFLGIGYMLIEIFLIQKLVFFLSDPVFSVSIVITTMLIISGLGSLYSNRFGDNPTKPLRIAIGLLMIVLFFYLFGLSPMLRALLGLPFIVKMLITILLIAPAAFLLGMPFPTGLSQLSENRKTLIPWAWGMNGALSVTGALLAKVLSMHHGFSSVIITSIVMYSLVALIFPVNMIKDEVDLETA